MNQKFNLTIKHALICLCLLPLTLLNLAGQTTSVPGRINYQGTLLNADGGNLDSGDYTLTFRVYSSQTGGSPLWGPQVFDGNPSGAPSGRAAQVPVVNGQFNIILGPQDTGTENNGVVRNLADAFLSSPTCFLEITIGDETVTTPIAPRQEILSAPFALQAEEAVNSVHAANAVPVGTIISLHPQAPTPDSNYWQLCDGGPVTSGSVLAGSMTNTPKLTDDRFLMGGANDNVPISGGSNTTPDHNHSIDEHSHTIAGHGHGRGNLSVSLGNNTHSHNIPNNGTLTDIRGFSQYVQDSYALPNTVTSNLATESDTHTHSVSLSGNIGNIDNANGDDTFTTSTHQSTTTTTELGLTDSRPQYFKVVYYIKIN